MFLPHSLQCHVATLFIFRCISKTWLSNSVHIATGWSKFDLSDVDTTARLKLMAHVKSDLILHLLWDLFRKLPLQSGQRWTVSDSLIRTGGMRSCLQLSGSVLQLVDAEFRRRRCTQESDGRQRPRRGKAAAARRCLQRAGDHDCDSGRSNRVWPGHAKRHTDVPSHLSLDMVSAVFAAVARCDVRRSTPAW